MVICRAFLCCVLSILVSNSFWPHIFGMLLHEPRQRDRLVLLLSQTSRRILGTLLFLTRAFTSGMLLVEPFPVEDFISHSVVHYFDITVCDWYVASRNIWMAQDSCVLQKIRGLSYAAVFPSARLWRSDGNVLFLIPCVLTASPFETTD